MKLRESVSAIFIAKDSKKVFSITRQDYLTVFPGYTAFPGGKVDRGDRETVEGRESPFKGISDTHWKALSREMKEELNFSLEENVAHIDSLYLLGTAITPEFNPYRFKAHFFCVILDTEIPFVVDEGEARESCWLHASELKARYDQCQLMAVPPIVMMLEYLAEDSFKRGPIDLSLPHIEELEVPMIESIKGVKQFLPLSNTFPPANRTNSFIIGDAPLRLWVDPSPKDEVELEKLLKSVFKIGYDALFISHHHSDHHEFLPEIHKIKPVPVYMSKVTNDLIYKKWSKSYLSSMDIRLLKDGDIISKSEGEPLQVYEVPGHDEGQLALAPKSLSWFFVGDLIQTIGTVVIGDEEGDMTKYFASLKRVMALSPKFCIPSHGIAIGGVHKLEMTLKHRLHREETILEMKIQGKSDEEILKTIYEGINPALVPYAKKTIAAHLIKLKAEYKI